MDKLAGELKTRNYRDWHTDRQTDRRTNKQTECLKMKTGPYIH